MYVNYISPMECLGKGLKGAMGVNLLVDVSLFSGAALQPLEIAANIAIHRSPGRSCPTIQKKTTV